MCQTHDDDPLRSIGLSEDDIPPLDFDDDWDDSDIDEFDDLDNDYDDWDWDYADPFFDADF